MSAIVVLMSAKGVLMSGQFFNDFSGHYVPHSASTSLGPICIASIGNQVGEITIT